MSRSTSTLHSLAIFFSFIPCGIAAGTTCDDVVMQQIAVQKQLQQVAREAAKTCDQFGDKSPRCRKLIVGIQRAQEANNTPYDSTLRLCPGNSAELVAERERLAIIYSDAISKRDSEGPWWRGCAKWKYEGAEFFEQVINNGKKQECSQDKDFCSYNTCEKL